MPWQLIYTSAPRGLLSGQSGFCTVGRSEDLREALVQKLEQISSYHYLRVSAVGTDSGNPTISAFRILDVRGAKYQVLTRIHPCGLDFTARTNHLAHHLIFQAAELAQAPSPAVILRGWSGWLAAWQGEPRLMRDVPVEELRDIKRPIFPAQAWLRNTGDAGRAAGLLDSDYVRGCYLVCPPGIEWQLLEMFAETLQLLDLTGQFPLRPWRHSFTTFMQAEDNPLDFQWRGCQEGTPAYQAAVRNAAPMVPLRSVRVPANTLVKIARDSQKTPAAVAPAPARSEPRPAPATLVRPERKAPVKPPVPVFDATHLTQAPITGRRPRFLSMNLWLDSSAVARLGIFAVALLAVVGAKIWMNRRSAVPEALPTVVIPSEPSRESAIPRPVAAAPRAQPDSTELGALWADGPTYLVLTSNMSSFDLPIQSSIRIQNLIHRYDSLNLLPGGIQLLFSTDRWDVSSEIQLPVSGRRSRQLTAGAEGGTQCVFDYSEWLNHNSGTMTVQTKLETNPSAISARFLFSSTNDGDAFRILAVNPNNPPAPMIMSREFLRNGGLDHTLSQRLAEIHPSDGETWRLEPFIKTGDGSSAHYLYEGWPRDERPAPNDELDFAGVKRRLATLEKPLRTNAAALQHTFKEWPTTNFNLPLGQALQSKNKHLASFVDFAGGDYSPGAFFDYLNRLKKDRLRLGGLGGWPEFFNDTETAGLTEEFERLYGLLTHKFPDSARDLTVDNTNYFYATWRDLVRLDVARREARRATDEWHVVRDRLDSVPSRLDETAYVGLFIVEREEAHPRVEMTYRRRGWPRNTPNCAAGPAGVSNSVR
jgi:hypothetical protein